jgi:hypothetical protein
MQGTRKVVNNWAWPAASALFAALALLFSVAAPAFGQQLVEGVWSGILTEPSGNPNRLGVEVTSNDGQLGIEMTALSSGARYRTVDVRAGDGTLAFAIEGVILCSLHVQEDGGYAGECTAPDGLGKFVMAPPGAGEPIELPADQPPSAAETVMEARPVDESGAVARSMDDTAMAHEDPAANPAPVANLGELLRRDLDTALERQLAVARRAAAQWQADARLHEVRLTINDAGEIGWRFHWLSDGSSRYLQLFSRAGSMRAGGEDPATAGKATLDPAAMAGFNSAVRALDEAGVDLASITPEEINSFELSYQDWRNPAGFYYYLFLTSGAQHWIVAETGELQN